MASGSSLSRSSRPASTWIGPDSTNFCCGHFGGPNDLIAFPGTYAYRTTFDLTGLDPASAMIIGNWSVDNVGLDILINGISLGITTPDDPYLGTTPYLTGFVPFTISGELAVAKRGIDPW